jgi:hypothetical protein
VTPTITPSTSPPAGNGPISIYNYGGFGPSINDVQPAFFFINSGNFPIAGGQVASGDHSAYNGTIDVTVTGAYGMTLHVYINNILISSVFVSSDGIYGFPTSFTIAQGDGVIIDLSNNP